MFSRKTLTAIAVSIGLLCATSPYAISTEPVPVVASFSILGDMVQRIGGAHVSVTTLVGPDGDTHVYQPTPADARAVSKAQLLFVNGLDFEGWIDRLVKASQSDRPQCHHNRGHHTRPLQLRAREPNKVAVKAPAM